MSSFHIKNVPASTVFTVSFNSLNKDRKNKVDFEPCVRWLRWPQLTFVPGLHHDNVACGIIAGIYGTECTLATGTTQDMRVLVLHDEKQRDIKTNAQLTMWKVT